eukprot:jgi/Chrzof1/1615/Cz10g14200.t1
MLRASVQALQRCLRSSAHEHLLLSVFGSSAQQLRNTTCGLTHPDGASCSGRSWLAVSFGRSAFASAAETSGELVIHDSAVQRLKQLQNSAPGTLLRIEVEGGGCSGFQYIFKLDQAVSPEDRVFEREGIKVVCDDVSMQFLRGAVVEFEDTLMRSAFQIASNPNSESTCGCGSSFVAKM